MFGFSLKSLAEAAFNTFIAPIESDQELDTLYNQAKIHENSLIKLDYIIQELENQVSAITTTNNMIFRYMDNLYNISHNHMMDAGIWNTAAHYYVCVDEMKLNVVPNINSCTHSIRKEIDKRRSLLYGFEKEINAYNKKQADLSDDEKTLKNLTVLSLKMKNNEDFISRIQEQISDLTKSIDKDQDIQAKSKSSLQTSLQEFISSNQGFIESSLEQLNQLLSTAYSTLSSSLSTPVPSSILTMKQPLIDGQPDYPIRFRLSAGVMKEKSVLLHKGSVVRWMFACTDSTLRFSLAFAESREGERVVVKEQRVKGEGLYDRGEYTSNKEGFLTLIWDNTYSLLTSQEVRGRMAVSHVEQVIIKESPDH